jgi:hypothetical protein
MQERADLLSFVKTRHIREQIMDEAIDLAIGPARRFPGIDLAQDQAVDQLLLVREFLESSGCLIGSEVLSYESQRPELTVDRDALAQSLGLDAKDPRPLLEQMLISHKKWLNYEK